MIPAARQRIGRLLRWPLRWIPVDARIRILRGPARGLRWIVGAGPHGIWLGRYEAPVQRALAGILREGDVFYDLGANAGFFTLLASRRVGASGRVVAFEPQPENLRFLETHLELNATTNVEVVAAAVASVSGSGRFEAASGRFTGRLSPAGELAVRTVALDEIVSGGRLPAPTVMKLDLEGGEVDALDGARGILAGQRPAILLATHGSDAYEACLRLLEAAGYRTERLEGDVASGCCEILAEPGRSAAPALRNEDHGLRRA